MERKEFFEKEGDILKWLYEQEGTLLSKCAVDGKLNITPELLLTKNFLLIYSDSVIFDNGFLYYDAFFKNKSDLYIYLSKKDIRDSEYKITIYFEPKNIEETKFFIKNLMKLKDGN